jgi:hypothetical protein
MVEGIDNVGTGTANLDQSRFSIASSSPWRFAALR